MSDSPLSASWMARAADATLEPTHTLRPDLDALAGTTPALPARRPESLPAISVDLRAASGAMPVADAPSAPGQRSDLEIRGVLGEGGMGRVLLARQYSLSRDVAVKTAKPDAPPAVRDALLVEGTVTGQLEHPAIVPVHALGLDPSGWPAMVMKRVEGVAWDALLADGAHPNWEGWEGTAADRLPGHLQILAAVCNALHFAHSRGFVHRDVKPQNVLIGRFGDVYLADWGVATQVGFGRGDVCGTPAFLAPEMVNGGAVDARTDVYLLGATLHFVLTGAMRHPGASVTESLLHARASPAFEYPAHVPEELASLANRACHLEPAQRPATAQAFREELSRYLRHREARALAEQAMRRVGELESLVVLEQPDEAQRRRTERLLHEARFGLEQALSQEPGNAAARAALERVEAIFEARQRRAAALEHEAVERDPLRGVGMRTLGIGGVTLATGLLSILALKSTGEAPPAALVGLPGLILALLLADVFLFRRHLLVTRFNRQVVAVIALGLGLMVAGRALGLLVPVPSAVHFARDAFVIVAVSAVAALTLLPWAAVVAALYLIVGAACVVVPAHAQSIFTLGSFLAMSFATGASASTWLKLRRSRPGGVR